MDAPRLWYNLRNVNCLVAIIFIPVAYSPIHRFYGDCFSPYPSYVPNHDWSYDKWCYAFQKLTDQDLSSQKTHSHNKWWDGPMSQLKNITLQNVLSSYLDALSNDNLCYPSKGLASISLKKWLPSTAINDICSWNNLILSWHWKGR